MTNQLVSIMRVAGDIVDLGAVVGLKITPTYTGQLPVMLSSIVWTIEKDGRVLVRDSNDIHSIINFVEYAHQQHYGLS
jgi:hypothetical protein